MQHLPDLSAIPIPSFAIDFARSDDDLKQAQRLRHQIFFPDSKQKDALDKDMFDDVCDHLLVYDTTGTERLLIGTYRLLRQSRMKELGKFYTESEFNIDALKGTNRELLELGRSCVHPDYRSGIVILLLWHAIAAYIEHFSIGYLFGCGSLPGTNVAEHQASLSYMHHHYRVDDTLAPYAIANEAKFEILPKESMTRQVFTDMPALIKGYLRLGCLIGNGAVIDPVCNTTDVCLVLPRERINFQYLRHFNKRVPADATAREPA